MQVSSTSVRPIVIEYIKKLEGGPELFQTGFACSKRCVCVCCVCVCMAWRTVSHLSAPVACRWIRTQMGALKQSYKRITNNAGHLPESYEEDIRKMRFRVAYLVGKHNVPPSLLLNLDETPLP